MLIQDVDNVNNFGFMVLFITIKCLLALKAAELLKVILVTLNLFMSSVFRDSKSCYICYIYILKFMIKYMF